MFLFPQLFAFLGETTSSAKGVFDFGSFFLIVVVVVVGIHYVIAFQHHLFLLGFGVLDYADQVSLFGIVKDNPSSVALSGSSATAHAVQMSHYIASKLELHHHRDTRNVQPPTGQIGTHQDRNGIVVVVVTVASAVPAEFIQILGTLSQWYFGMVGDYLYTSSANCLESVREHVLRCVLCDASTTYSRAL